MDCVGSICSGNKISLFGVNPDSSIDIYKSYTPSRPSSVINAIKFHPDTEQLLCGGTDGAFQLTVDDISTAHPLNTMTGNVSCVTSNSQWIGLSQKNTMNVYSRESGQVISTKTHRDNYQALSFIANRYIIGADIRGEILIHNCNNHLLSTSFKGYVNQNGIQHIDVTKNRINWFIACNDSGFNYLFDITREKIIYYDYSHASPASQCAFNPIYSSLFVSCSLDQKVLVHDVNRKKIGIEFETKAPLSSVQYCRDSDKYIICGSTNGDLYLYDLRRYNMPLHETKTEGIILDLDIHPTLKVSALSPQINVEPEPVMSCAVTAVNSKKSKNREITESKPAMETEMKIQNTSENVQDQLGHSILSASDAVAGLPQYLSKRFGNVQIEDCPPTEEMKTEVLEEDPCDMSTSWRAPKRETESTNISKAKNVVNFSLSADDMNELEDRFRVIVKEEIAQSEKRIEEKVSGMMSQMHSDLVEQFITNDSSMEKHIERLFQFMVEFKHQNSELQHELRYAKF